MEQSQQLTCSAPVSSQWWDNWQSETLKSLQELADRNLKVLG
jgi:hypothetical protein